MGPTQLSWDNGLNFMFRKTIHIPGIYTLFLSCHSKNGVNNMWSMRENSIGVKHNYCFYYIHYFAIKIGKIFFLSILVFLREMFSRNFFLLVGTSSYLFLPKKVPRIFFLYFLLNTYYVFTAYDCITKKTHK